MFAKSRYVMNVLIRLPNNSISLGASTSVAEEQVRSLNRFNLLHLYDQRLEQLNTCGKIVNLHLFVVFSLMS